MQQISEQQLHTPFSLFPLFPTVCHLQSNVSNDLILPRTFPESLAHNGCPNVLLNEGI